MELKATFITTIAEFRDIVGNTDRVVLIYFYAEWSPACRRIRFEFKQAELKNREAIYLAANVDIAKGLMHKMGLTLDDIPAVVICKDGKVVHWAKNITVSDFDNVYFESQNEEIETTVEEPLRD